MVFGLPLYKFIALVAINVVYIGIIIFMRTLMSKMDKRIQLLNDRCEYWKDKCESANKDCLFWKNEAYKLSKIYTIPYSTPEEEYERIQKEKEEKYESTD